VNLSIDPDAAEVLVVPARAAGLAGRWVVVLVLDRDPDMDHTAAVIRSDELRRSLGVVGPDWVRRTEAARRAGVSVKMIDKHRRAGRLRSLQVSATRAYVHAGDLAALLARQDRQPAGQASAE
jgi:hypothetical protein